MFKKTILAAMLAAASLSAVAADFYVVVPVPNRASPVTVALNSYSLPDGTVGVAYAGFDFKSLLQISGDPAYAGSGVTWAITGGTLPTGLTLGSAGVLAGTPTVPNQHSAVQVTATYRSAKGSQTYQINSVAVVLPVGQSAYTVKGTYAWTAPAGVTSVSVVAVGGGEFAQYAGNGSALAWKNNIPVTPGQSYTVVVGAAAANWNYNPSVGVSYFIDTNTVMARVGSFVGDGGGLGGLGAKGFGGSCGTGGGAGGYTGAGGNGAVLATSAAATIQATDGSGGGGGGGATTSYNYGGSYGCGGGGGVGIYGQGANGAADVIAVDGVSGGGGSGGTNGHYKTVTAAGNFGAGGAVYSSNYYGAGGGAVRIIWGAGRAFPSTLTADQ